jgi:hypothetical protein
VQSQRLSNLLFHDEDRGHDVVLVAVAYLDGLLWHQTLPLNQLLEEVNVWFLGTEVLGGQDEIGGQLEFPEQSPRALGLPGNSHGEAAGLEVVQAGPDVRVEISGFEALPKRDTCVLRLARLGNFSCRAVALRSSSMISRNGAGSQPAGPAGLVSWHLCGQDVRAINVVSAQVSPDSGVEV